MDLTTAAKHRFLHPSKQSAGLAATPCINQCKSGCYEVSQKTTLRARPKCEFLFGRPGNSLKKEIMNSSDVVFDKQFSWLSQAFLPVICHFVFDVATQRRPLHVEHIQEVIYSFSLVVVVSDEILHLHYLCCLS